MILINLFINLLDSNFFLCFADVLELLLIDFHKCLTWYDDDQSGQAGLTTGWCKYESIYIIIYFSDF